MRPAAVCGAGDSRIKQERDAGLRGFIDQWPVHGGKFQTAGLGKMEIPGVVGADVDLPGEHPDRAVAKRLRR